LVLELAAAVEEEGCRSRGGRFVDDALSTETYVASARSRHNHHNIQAQRRAKPAAVLLFRSGKANHNSVPAMTPTVCCGRREPATGITNARHGLVGVSQTEVLYASKKNGIPTMR